MAMADEGQAKEIPLATARPVHVLLGSWWYRHPRGGDLSRSRKDSVPYSPRSSADQQRRRCWSADERRHIQLGSLRDLNRSPPRGCRYHQDPSRTCTGHAVASGISFACPSSSMAIVSPCKREPEKETLKFEDSFPASFSFATKRSSFDETEGMTVGSPQAGHRST